MNNETLALQVLVYRRKEQWHGVCLKPYVCSQAETAEAAFADAERMVRVTLKSRANLQAAGNALAPMVRAPQVYWDECYGEEHHLKGVQRHVCSEPPSQTVRQQPTMSPAALSPVTA